MLETQESKKQNQRNKNINMANTHPEISVNSTKTLRISKSVEKLAHINQLVTE